MRYSAKHVGYGPGGTPAGIVIDSHTGEQVGTLTSLANARRNAKALNEAANTRA